MYIIGRDMRTSQRFDLLLNYIAFFSFFVVFRFLYEFQTQLFSSLYFELFYSYWNNVIGTYVVLQTQAGIDRHRTEDFYCFSSNFI